MVTEDGIVTEIRVLQPLNALSAILVTDDGIAMYERPPQAAQVLHSNRVDGATDTEVVGNAVGSFVGAMVEGVLDGTTVDVGTGITVDGIAVGQSS